MKIKALIGAGDQIMGVTMPVALIGIVLNTLYPEFFRTNLGQIGTVLGFVLLAIGVPMWLTSAVQVLVHVPHRRLITTGPFAITLHPLYTSVALLVVPGVGFVLETWVGLGIGIVLYAASRLLSVKEERKLEETFPVEYQAYRAKVLLPWL